LCTLTNYCSKQTSGWLLSSFTGWKTGHKEEIAQDHKANKYQSWDGQSFKGQGWADTAISHWFSFCKFHYFSLFIPEIPKNSALYSQYH
jgi:hypothetical protein